MRFIVLRQIWSYKFMRACHVLIQKELGLTQPCIRHAERMRGFSFVVLKLNFLPSALRIRASKPCAHAHVKRISVQGNLATFGGLRPRHQQQRHQTRIRVLISCVEQHNVRAALSNNECAPMQFACKGNRNNASCRYAQNVLRG